MKKAFHFKIREKDFLGFNTGLDAQTFAQAKIAQFLTQQGRIVYPDGTVKPWMAASVEENHDGCMIVYGPAFPGESFLTLLSDADKREAALDAIRFWIKAKAAMEMKDDKASTIAGAAGSFIILNPVQDLPFGTVLFAPERIVKRSLEAAGDDDVEAAQQWVHPDLAGEESTVFSAAAMLYAVFCGEPPFFAREPEKPNEKDRKADGRSVIETLRRDIREGVYLPPELAVPGLDKELCKLINETLENKKKRTESTKRPSLNDFAACLGRAGKINSWVSPLSEEANQKIIQEREQYRKTKNLQVKTRRFVLRNTAVLTACAAALITVILSINGYIRRQAELPTTRGMVPAEVVETYYGAFAPMDHILMEACLLGKAGRGDINMVTNLYVITRMRGAYEANLYNYAGAQEWLDAGMPETELTIFGITDLKFRVVSGSESQGEIVFEAEYRLWMPAGFMPDEENASPVSFEELEEGNFTVPPPVAIRFRDMVSLVMHKDAWRINDIVRAGI